MKELRAKKAREQTNYYAKKYKKEINHSVRNTTIYEKSPTDNVHSSGLREIIVRDTDTVSALFDVVDKKVAILNFASFKNPGGGYLRGSRAQEEALCMESVLYNVISTQTEFYEYNKKHTNKSMYLDRALYSEDVLFIKDNVEKKADVLTCACPNKAASPVSKYKNTFYLKNRIDFVLSIFAAHPVDVIILGAFGCGVFGQNPKEVATLFKEGIDKIFDNKQIEIIFAIPPGPNYDNFLKIF